MSEYTLTKSSLQGLMGLAQDELEKEPVIIVTMQSGNTGKWGLARLWRAWMSSTAKFMTANGCTMPLMLKQDGSHYGKRPFNAGDAHELFTCQHLGVDAKGVRLSWAKKAHDGMRAATKGERFNALFKHQIWANEKGITLFNPRDSDYSKLKDEQGY